MYARNVTNTPVMQTPVIPENLAGPGHGIGQNPDRSESYHARRSARDPAWHERQLREAAERERRRREADRRPSGQPGVRQAGAAGRSRPRAG
jgi:hypothetical protein